VGSTLAGRSVLIVDDERLICLDLKQRLQEAGAKPVIAGRLDRALKLADDPQLSAAVLDFRLDQVDTSPVCERLVQRGIPFLFYSGALHRAYQRWPTAPILLKPSINPVVNTLLSLLAHGPFPPPPKI
jgi:DNA-binding NtrC family response regulator